MGESIQKNEAVMHIFNMEREIQLAEYLLLSTLGE
jgi:hypothetical protein